MASIFTRPNDDIEQRIAALAKEIHSLKKVAAKRGAAAYSDGSEMAADIYSDLRDRFDEALPRIRSGARAIERRAHDNPAATALVGLAVIGLLAALLVGKKR